MFSAVHRPLPLVEVTAQTVVITAAVSAAYFLKGMARHLDQRERSMNHAKHILAAQKWGI